MDIETSSEIKAYISLWNYVPNSGITENAVTARRPYASAIWTTVVVDCNLQQLQGDDGHVQSTVDMIVACW